MDVSIVMINYNTFDLTKNAIESINKYTKGIEYEIFLIDNASPDKSGKKLKSLFDNNEVVKVILSNDNLGTSKAFNFCAKKSKAKYVLWINSDILVKENFIKKLFDFMEKTPSAGLCGGAILDFEGNKNGGMTDVVNDFKDIKNDSKIFNFFKSKKENGDNVNEISEVAQVSGADMFIRNDVLKKIGYLDEDIFMYGEDTEFCFRVRKFGYGVYFVPSAHIFHLEGGSSARKKFNSNVHKYFIDGTSIFLLKCFGKNEQIKFLNFSLKKYKKYKLFSRIFLKSKFYEYSKKVENTNEILKKYK